MHSSGKGGGGCTGETGSDWYLLQEAYLPASGLFLEAVDGVSQLLDLLLGGLEGVDLVLDGHHVPLHLDHLALAALHALRQVLQLRPARTHTRTPVRR